MKFSLKLPDDHDLKSPILKAKLPISIFNQPFTSAFTSAINSSSDLSFSLSTNFLSGPCLKLTYSPTPSSLSAASAAAAGGPFSLSLKSGLGLFGSPQNSPLVFSAQFSLSLTKPVIPTFSLLFSPQLGHFCLKKSTVSTSSSNSNQFHVIPAGDGVKSDSGSHSNSKFDESLGWQELKLEPGIGIEPQRQLGETKAIREGIFSGVAVMARTAIPVTKRAAVSFRWGMNFPANFATKTPYLTVNKISVERVEEEKEEKKKKTIDGDEMELLKGMLFWMKKDVETLEKENQEMKKFLEEMKGLNREISSYGELQPWRKNRSSGEDTDWRKKRSTEEVNEGKNSKRNGEKSGFKGQNFSNRVNEVESELERAIKAASQVKA